MVGGAAVLRARPTGSVTAQPEGWYGNAITRDDGRTVIMAESGSSECLIAGTVMVLGMACADFERDHIVDLRHEVRSTPQGRRR